MTSAATDVCYISKAAAQSAYNRFAKNEYSDATRQSPIAARR